MAYTQLTPKQMQEAIDAYAERGSAQKAADALGMPYGRYNPRLMRARSAGYKPSSAAQQRGADRVQELAKANTPVRRPTDGFEVRSVATEVDADGKTKGQWIGERLQGRDAETVPDGHLIKGLSTLVDETGRTRAQWIKTTIDADKFKAMTLAACRAAASKVKPLARVKAPRRTNEDLLTQYTITDYHMGMLAWTKETGEPWDLVIAERVLMTVLSQMIDAAPASAVGLLAQLGDFLHFDSMKPVTPEHGHLLDADSRYQKVVEVTVRVLRWAVLRLLEKHQTVMVDMHEGNHDPSGSIWMRVLYSALFENNPRVIVEKSPLPYVAHQHGKTMLGFHHGHLSKNQSLPLLFAAKFSEMWGATKKRYIHSGHRHHVDEKEFPGVKVIQHPTLAAPDAYAARGGWLSERQATSMTYHKEQGEIARGIFLPPE